MSNANSSQTTEHIEFKGKYGPLLDEIAIREFKDKNVMTPLYKGAFKSVSPLSHA